ncbi:MAG: large repetitive protein [Actinomycetota bacterium]|jgi:hypothetical protein
MRRRLLAAAAALPLALLVTLLPSNAGAEASVSGWTNACFSTGCTPGTSSSLQVSPLLGMAYINATFAGSTADGALALGGAPDMPNVDNLGSLMLAAVDASYEGVTFDLRIRIGGATVAVPAVLHGAVTAGGTGGVVVDFANDPHPFALGEGVVLAVSVQDVAVSPGATVAVSGVVTTSDGAPPAGAVVPTPVPGATPLAIAGVAAGRPFAGHTAGGVLPLALETVSVVALPGVNGGQYTIEVALDTPVRASAVFTGTVTGTVVAAGTGAYVIDFPDAPVIVDMPGGRLSVSVNDLAVAPGHDAVLTGQIVQPPWNQPPVATADTFSRKSGNHDATGNVLGNDSDPEGDPLTAELVSDAANGSVTLAPNGTFTYRSRPPHQAPDSFVYRVSDGRVWSAPVAVTITPANAKR